MTEQLAQATIVGAGVVGLAIAAELAERGVEVCVLERHDSFGQEQSSRNSEVIHAGIYYPPGSLKARLCVEANPLLYDICQKAGIGCWRLTKMIVACDADEEARLATLSENGWANEVPGLEMLTAAEVKALEPNVRCRAALLSETTGIIDTHALMQHYAHRAEAAGAMIAYGSELLGIEKTGDGFTIEVRDPEETARYHTDTLVNAAGLGSDRVATMAGIDIDAAGYRIYPCKGVYFSVGGGKAKMIKRLVYPVPAPKGRGLGTHATLDLGGQMRLGPDTAYVDAIDYDVDPARGDAFYESAVRFLPFLERDDLSPGTAGIRAKLQGPNDPAVRDFVIRHEKDRGLEGLIDLVGIESPGLTASPAIARHVARMMREDGLVC